MRREPDAQNIRNICVFMRVGRPDMPEAPGLGVDLPEAVLKKYMPTLAG